MAKPKDSPGQQQIDFSARGVQLALLTKARLPSAGGVSGMRLKAVLREIDNYARGGVGWPSYETIAEGVQMSFGQVRRAVAALVSLSLICVERRGVKSAEPTRRSCNHYRIVWSEVALLGPDQVRLSGVSSALFGGIKCAPGAHLTAKKRPEPPPPTPKPAKADGNPSWKAAAAAFSKAGIGAAQVLIRKCKAAGVSPAEAVERCLSGQRVVQEHPEAFRSPVGALAYHVETGGWPLDGVDRIDWRRAPAVDLDQYQPAIDAMTDEERLELLPAGRARDNYELFGRHAPEVAWLLRHAYHVRYGSAAATA